MTSQSWPHPHNHHLTTSMTWCIHLFYMAQYSKQPFAQDVKCLEWCLAVKQPAFFTSIASVSMPHSKTSLI